jgi:CysZ protein
VSVSAPAPELRRGNVVGEFLAGIRLLGRGLTLVLRRRRLFWFGVIPPLIMSLLFGTLFVLLVVNLTRIADWLTPFADSWANGAEQAVEFVAGAALLGGTSLLMIVTFTTLTLALGAPIYDKISEHVDTELEPGLRPPPENWTRAIGRSLRNSLILIGISALVAPLFFAAGFIPVVGQVVVPVVSACFGGWMLCIELIGSTFERHGRVRLGERRAAMQRHRARSLGLAVPTFLLMSIPIVGTLVFPTATAAGTLLGRELLDLPSRSQPT